MYLLYEKEVDEAMKTELERMLYWISEAVKLNPSASWAAILNAADDYVKANTYKIYKERKSLFDKEEILREAEQKSAFLEFLDKTQVEAELPLQETTEAEIEVEEIVEEESEAVEEIPVFDNQDDETVERKNHDQAYAEIAGFDEDDSDMIEVVVPAKEAVEEIPVFDNENDESSEEKDERESRQMTVRMNHNIIFGNPDEINEL